VWLWDSREIVRHQACREIEGLVNRKDRQMLRTSVAAVAASLCLCCHSASAGPGYDQNGRPLICTAVDVDGNVVMTSEQLSACRQWIKKILQPNRRATCCGEADAFEANDFGTDNDGNLYAVITQDYSTWAMEAYPSGLKPGDHVLIPPSRINDATKDGNPTGKGIVFLSTAGVVICYLGPWGN